MGWWDTGVMGGDTPLDLKGALCDVMGVSFNYEDAGYHYDRALLEAHRDKLVAFIETGDHWVKWHRDTAYQVLGHMLMSRGAEIPDDLRERIVQAAKSDKDWREPGHYDPERAEAMTTLIGAIRAHRAGYPSEIRQVGLIEKLVEKVSN